MPQGGGGREAEFLRMNYQKLKEHLNLKIF